MRLGSAHQTHGGSFWLINQSPDLNSSWILREVNECRKRVGATEPTIVMGKARKRTGSMTWPPVVLYNFSVAVVPVFAGDK